jgi:hypothetical protein
MICAVSVFACVLPGDTIIGVTFLSRDDLSRSSQTFGFKSDVKNRIQVLC